QPRAEIASFQPVERPHAGDRGDSQSHADHRHQPLRQRLKFEVPGPFARFLGKLPQTDEPFENGVHRCLPTNVAKHASSPIIPSRQNARDRHTSWPRTPTLASADVMAVMISGSTLRQRFRSSSTGIRPRLLSRPSGLTAYTLDAAPPGDSCQLSRYRPALPVSVQTRFLPRISDGSCAPAATSAS